MLQGLSEFRERSKREVVSLSAAFVVSLAGYVGMRVLSSAPMATFTWLDFALIASAYAASTALFEHRSVVERVLQLRRERKPAWLRQKEHSPLVAEPLAPYGQFDCSALVGVVSGTSELDERLRVSFIEAVHTFHGHIDEKWINQPARTRVGATFTSPEHTLFALAAALQVQRVALFYHARPLMKLALITGDEDPEILLGRAEAVGVRAAPGSIVIEAREKMIPYALDLVLESGADVRIRAYRGGSGSSIVIDVREQD